MSLREKLFQFNVDLPLDRACTIPSSWYLDAEVAELEKKASFLSHWQMVGHARLLQDPGNFISLNLAGEPVAVARDREGTLRAFSNVCRHRGACVVNSPHGKAGFFQCRYHGWTYDLRGRLKGTPEFEGVSDFFREENSLPSWHVETWGNFVFVHGGRHAVPLHDELSPFIQRSPIFGLDRMTWMARKEYELQCNWKVFVDNYLDGGYHINTLHPELAGIIQYTQYRTEILGNCSLQVSPLQADLLTASSVRKGAAAHYWWIYPNLMINLYDGVMDTNVVFPLDEKRCRVVFDFYFDAAAAEGFIERSMEASHQIQLEDISICEEVQRNLPSRSYDTGRFSVRREGGGHHFHQLLAEELQMSVG